MKFESNIIVLNTLLMKRKETGEVFHKVTYGIRLEDKQKSGFNGFSTFETFVDNENIFEKATKSIGNIVKASLTLKATKDSKFIPTIIAIN